MVDSVVPSTEPKEPTTVTSDQIVYQQRVRVLAHSRESGNVAATCRTFGISRKTFYKWRDVAEQYGIEALWPKKRRPDIASSLRTGARRPPKNVAKAARPRDRANVRVVC